MPVYAVQKSNPVIHAHAHTHTHILLFLYYFQYGLSQKTGYSSLYYTAGPHCLFILNVVVCIVVVYFDLLLIMFHK